MHARWGETQVGVGDCAGNKGGRHMSGGAGGAPQAMCANCLHPVDLHVEEAGRLGRACGVSIADVDCDGPVSCPCERCIEQGTACSVEGCGETAVHFRANNAKSRIFDMCLEHYKEAEPCGRRYYELTGGRVACGVDGCGGYAITNIAGEGGSRLDVCYDHIAGCGTGGGPP